MGGAGLPFAKRSKIAIALGDRYMCESQKPEGEPALILDIQRDELDRRIAAIDAGTVEMSPWEEVEVRVLARISK